MKKRTHQRVTRVEQPHIRPHGRLFREECRIEQDYFLPLQFSDEPLWAVLIVKTVFQIFRTVPRITNSVGRIRRLKPSESRADAREAFSCSSRRLPPVNPNRRKQWVHQNGFFPIVKPDQTDLVRHLEVVLAKVGVSFLKELHEFPPCCPH